MEKRLRIAFTELNRIVFECSCGTEISIDAASSYPVPGECPCCDAIFDRQTVGAITTAFKQAFKQLSRLSENNAYNPRIVFCIKPKESDSD
jgi:hypothetical protein